MNSDIITLLIGFGMILIGGLLFPLNHYLEDNILAFKKLQYVNSKPNGGLSLGTGNSIGFSLLEGVNLNRYIGNRYVCSVSYHFFVILYLPIIPLGCYNARCTGHARKGSSYLIGGKQKMNFWEILWIYTGYWSYSLVIIGIIFVIISLIALS